MLESLCHSMNPFVTLSPQERDLVCHVGQQQKLSGSQLIFSENDPPESVYYIKTGHVKIYRNSANGKVAMVGIRQAGDLIGVCEVLAKMSRRGYAETLGAVELVRIDAARFIEVLSDHAVLAVKVATALGNRLRQAESLASNMAAAEVDRRLARLLLHLASYGQSTDNGVCLLVPLTHQDMAAMIGSCRQTVTSTLKNFKEAGILVTSRAGKRTMEILDVPQLQKLAEN